MGIHIVGFRKELRQLHGGKFHHWLLMLLTEGSLHVLMQKFSEYQFWEATGRDICALSVGLSGVLSLRKT